MSKLKLIAILTLMAFSSAGFSFLDNFSFTKKSISKLEAASKKTKRSKKSNKSEAQKDSKSNENIEDKDKDLLADNEKSQNYLPEIFRCPECGYEQDEEGFCPDHTSLKLNKVFSSNNNPLTPKELDGNEDIIVDVPLNLDFKNVNLEKKNKENLEKDSKKTKKR